MTSEDIKHQLIIAGYERRKPLLANLPSSKTQTSVIHPISCLLKYKLLFTQSPVS